MKISTVRHLGVTLRPKEWLWNESLSGWKLVQASYHHPYIFSTGRCHISRVTSSLMIDFFTHFMLGFILILKCDPVFCFRSFYCGGGVVWI